MILDIDKLLNTCRYCAIIDIIAVLIPWRSQIGSISKVPSSGGPSYSDKTLLLAQVQSSLKKEECVLQWLTTLACCSGTHTGVVKFSLCMVGVLGYVEAARVLGLPQQAASHL